MNIEIDPQTTISTPVTNCLEPNTETVLREIEMYFSQRYCYDNMEQFSYQEIVFVLNKKIKQIEENRRSKKNDILFNSVEKV